MSDPTYQLGKKWLDLAHKRLDKDVFTAYDWKSDLSDEEILENLLSLNLERAGKVNDSFDKRKVLKRSHSGYDIVRRFMRKLYEFYAFWPLCLLLSLSQAIR